MTDELLPYFDKELAFLRELLDTEFRENNPRIATRLGLGPASIKDPHILALIQGIAYLNARIRSKLDDEFPELTHTLLEALYPHFLAPVPSMAVVQFEPKANTPAGYPVSRETYLETSEEPNTGEPCIYRTSYHVNLWPLQVEEASYAGRPLPGPPVAGTQEAQGVVRIRLKCLGEDVTMADLAPASLRFFLKGPEQSTFPLYELLLNNPVQVAVTPLDGDGEPVILGPQSLRAVGFKPEEAALPCDPRRFSGYRLLTEFFAFSRKFLFFELTGLDSNTVRGLGNGMTVAIYTRESDPDLVATVSADTFALGCTPVINLFEQVAEPQPVGHETYEYEVVAERRRRRAIEVYSVDRVFTTDETGKVRNYHPFFGAWHGEVVEDEPRFWHLSRRKSRHHPGSELFLSLVDLNFKPDGVPTDVMTIKTTCLNRDLPNTLPFGGGQPRLTLREGGAPVEMKCLTPPTRTLRPALREGAWWRLLSHLNLNYLSISDPVEGTQALREILKLYDLQDSEQTRAMLEGLVRISSRPVASRTRVAKRAGFCQGTAIEMLLDETRFAVRDQFLFASVLERFFSLYCTINSFTQLSVTVKGGKKLLCKWPPRAGEHPLV